MTHKDWHVIKIWSQTKPVIGIEYTLYWIYRDIVLSEFEIQSRYDVHVWNKTFDILPQHQQWTMLQT